MIMHIPYLCSTATIVGAIIFAINGNIQIAGLFLVVSGLLYFTLSEKILVTTKEIEERFPQLKFISRLVGGNTPPGIKFGGVVLFIVGVIWIFFV
jgi:Gpi18-like mannosyltransferase